MRIFKLGYNVVMEAVLPFVFLLNFYAFFILSGGNDFWFGITPNMVANWRNSYFGMTSLRNYIENTFTDAQLSELTRALRYSVDTISFHVNSYIEDLRLDGTVLQKILTSVIWLVRAIAQPIEILASMIYVLVRVCVFLGWIFYQTYLAILGQYNLPLPDYSNGWNTISEYVYAY